ncbi:MAG: 4-hydroxy-tetrahydrodipicolinate synthase [Reichenbachiella sp.]
MAEMFRGTGVALVTPFREDLSVDYDALAQLVEHLTDGGVDYLVVMGTTAESPTLNNSEKIKVLECVQSHNLKRLPVVYGMGGNNTASLVDQYKKFEGEVDAFLVVTPYYNRPNQQGLIRHYEAIADVAKKPIILYNVPKRTGVNMEAETVIRLSAHPNIIGVKEASGGNLEQTAAIAAGVPDGFLLTSGDDDLIIPFIKAGGHGVISVIANALPKETVALVSEIVNGNEENADAVNANLTTFLDLIFQEGSPSGIKHLLKELGIGNGKLRLPLVEVSDGLGRQLKELAKNLSIKKGVI